MRQEGAVRMVPLLVMFCEHNTRANLRLLDFCARLSDEQLDASAPGTFGRVRDTLVHIVRDKTTS